MSRKRQSLEKTKKKVDWQNHHGGNKAGRIQLRKHQNQMEAETKKNTLEI